MNEFYKTLNTIQRTTKITREDGEPLGARLVTDATSPFAVRAFPFNELSAIAANRTLGLPGAYVVPFHQRGLAYIGESGDIGTRLAKHAADPKKSAADEAFVIFSIGDALDREARRHVERRMMELIERAAIYRLMNEAPPYPSNLAPERIAELDQMIFRVVPLLVDAGCRFICAAMSPVGLVTRGENVSSGQPSEPQENGSEDAEEDGPMAIGVSTVPIGVEEMELAYGNLWARGYLKPNDPAGKRFIVAAGSEMRAAPNAIHPRALEHRDKLIETNTAVPIPGVTDRLRILKPVEFFSRAVAVKVLTGTHVGSDAWQPLPPASPFAV